jgi:hypothetical protein
MASASWQGAIFTSCLQGGAVFLEILYALMVRLLQVEHAYPPEIVCTTYPQSMPQGATTSQRRCAPTDVTSFV